MPDYTIETTYHLPISRTRTYSADTAEAACHTTIKDDDWEEARNDHETPGEIHVTGIWEGADAAYRGSAIPVPSQFRGMTERKTVHCEILLGILKIVVSDAQAGRSTSADWMVKAASATSRSEAILAGAPDSHRSVDLPEPYHVLAFLREDRVRAAIAAILQVDHDFGGLAPDAVTDEEIHAACLTVVTVMDLSDETRTAEFQAGMAALRQARRRRSV
ncbi:hypothetical protein [Rhizobium lentis]|uniref:Uncharacterized protein n=1 Tax=Rhizobium lentis TaxID=1138194 RepID=A0A7W8UNS6_9HYPH|nr:hypothetical protein [Rhizobium lentis]MBB4574577.1 hypothetical protein [Rhizobium lentis]MBB5550504.1 hypothetical protein [Rhizobium lentis]MBB5561374.1 hypothetical protein [Rhizobium lentis]MBB5567623.1 hypothetical protein [Rhizobium lentis]